MPTDHQLLATRRATDRAEWRGQMPTQLFARLEPSPVIGDALCGLGDALLRGLDGRVLELVALRVSAARECLYVWRGHCVIALGRPQDAFTSNEIARVAAGAPALHGWDAVVVQAVDELLERGNLASATRSRLGDLALGVTIATHFYATVAAIMRDAEPDAEAVAGLETAAAAASRVEW